MGLAVVFAFIGLGWSVLGHLSLLATIGVTLGTAIFGAIPGSSMWNTKSPWGR